MLPDGNAVREAILGWAGGGIAAALKPGAVVLDMSSSDPVGTQTLAQDLAPAGIRVIDAPVSGGITRAETGTLSLMVGGQDEDAFAQVRPVLETLGERIFRTGPLGSGHAMKALNNFLGASAYTAAVEALAIGKEFGLDPAVMLNVVNSSTGRSFNTEVVLKNDVITGRYGTGFALGLLAKDVGIAADLAESVGVPAPACSSSPPVGGGSGRARLRRRPFRGAQAVVADRPAYPRARQVPGKIRAQGLAASVHI